MIPKIIHYCWFGKGNMPLSAKKCIKSWKKYCKGYRLMLWNEDTFDVNSNQYVKEAYENKKYAFVTDYVRLYALYHYGGVYMDTDYEVIKPIDQFLIHDAFSGFESNNRILTALMASDKNLSITKELLDYYNNRHFLKEDGSFDLTPNTETITNIFINKGIVLNNKLQTIEGFTFYPLEFFCPINWKTREKEITSNTFGIHWFIGSWVPTEEKKENKKMQRKKLIRKNMDMIFGSSNSDRIIRFLKGER